jgi:hypothetical protein
MERRGEERAELAKKAIATAYQTYRKRSRRGVVVIE